MGLKDRHRSITVRGLVCPTEWDEDDAVCGVSILTFDEDEFEVEPVDAGQYLIHHTGEEVMARVHLVTGFRRRKVAVVKSFTVFNRESPELHDSELGSEGIYRPRTLAAE